MKAVIDLCRKSIRGFNKWNPAKQDLFVKLAFEYQEGYDAELDSGYIAFLAETFRMIENADDARTTFGIAEEEDDSVIKAVRKRLNGFGNPNTTITNAKGFMVGWFDIQAESDY